MLYTDKTRHDIEIEEKQKVAITAIKDLFDSLKEVKLGGPATHLDPNDVFHYALEVKFALGLIEKELPLGVDWDNTSDYDTQRDVQSEKEVTYCDKLNTTFELLTK